MLLTRVQFIFNTLLKVAFISSSIHGWGQREKKLLLDTALVSFRSLSLPIIHHHFLVFSHQGTLPRLCSCYVPDNLAWNIISSNTIQILDAPRTFSPRNAFQGRRTWSVPKFGFFPRACVKASDCVFSLRLQ